MSETQPNLFMMPWFPRDFLASTRGWPLISRAIYRELLDTQWEQGGLPADMAALRDLVGATIAQWRVGWVRVEPKFPIGGDGLRRNWRLEQHRQKAIGIALKRAQVGKTGGKASASKRQAIAQPIAATPSQAIGQPLVNHQNKTTPKRLSSGESSLQSKTPDAQRLPSIAGFSVARSWAGSSQSG
jgi:hypothetical protein